MASRQPRKKKDDAPDDPVRGGRSADQRASGNAGVTEREVEDIEERSVPRTPVIYEIVRRLGEEEMARPVMSLWWSGVAAGLSISFSLLAQAILRTHLPDEAWRPLVESFGYSIGFVMVVLSRQQLFTENTVTVVLPVMADFTTKNLRSLARMWTVVFLANMAGTLFASLFCTFTPVLTPELRAGMMAISGQLLEHSWLETMVMAIGAGFLMAAMVWLLPGSETAQFFVVVMMTWLIAAGGFTHVVAGSMEAFMLALNGGMGFWAMLGDFFVPVLIGNIVGGTALFALLAYAQVMQEI
jgi:formate/nitrite transporter FocA (FNT family)